MDNPSLYIHIPFCRSKCLYCDFYSIAHDAKIAATYIDTIIRQLAASPHTFSSVYIGGGTPTVLGDDLLGRLVDAVARRCHHGSEITVEANPESLTPSVARRCRSCGANRISIGVQSLCDEKLKRLGRIHNRDQALTAVNHARDAGFVNISVDAIFGIWNETPESWYRELDELTKLPITHLSAYMLSYEQGTPLYALYKTSAITPLAEEAVGELYTQTRIRLAMAGFAQYEISNFARPGYACRHNIRYWENGSYLGLGSAAVSYIDGVRSRNVADVHHYIARLEQNQPPSNFSETLDPQQRARETAAFKIRMAEGIPFAWFSNTTGFELPSLASSTLSRLVNDGLITYRIADGVPVGIALTTTGFLHADTVSAALV